MADSDGNIIEKLYYNSTGLCKSYYLSGDGLYYDKLRGDGSGYNLCRSEFIPFGWCGMYRDQFTGLYHTHFREYDPLHGRWLSKDPAGYADGLNLYNAYMGVNGVDPLGLWDEAGVIDEYSRLYGNDEKAMTAIFMVMTQYSLGQGKYYFDDWGVNHTDKSISIASTAWLGWERSNTDAAKQLHQVLSDVFYEATGLPETWGGMGRRLGSGALKTIGGVGSCIGGSALLAAPEPTMLTKAGGVGAYAFGSNMTVDGVTQMFNRGGGINLINEGLGAYGQWMAGNEGEAQARFWGSMSELLFTGAGNIGKTNVGNVSIRQMPVATKAALKKSYINFGRMRYVSKVKSLKNKIPKMRKAGKSWEEIARTLHAERRALGVKYKNITPKDLLDEIYKRNLTRYGDELGPTIDYFRNVKMLSWEDIARSAYKPGGKDLGF